MSSERLGLQFMPKVRSRRGLPGTGDTRVCKALGATNCYGLVFVQHMFKGEAVIVDCFARRVMATFQGISQTVRLEHGEAESTDGHPRIMCIAHPDNPSHYEEFFLWSK